MHASTHTTSRPPSSLRARARGVTITELLALMVIVTLVLATAVPALARLRGISGVQGSIDNLIDLGMAHLVYAADWNGRQVTWVRDDLSVYGSVTNYNNQVEMHPHIIWGWGCDSNLWMYNMNSAGHHWAVQPINFTGGASYFGNFRFANTRPFHDYVGGRIYDDAFYAPNDQIALDLVAPSFELPCEYDQLINPPGWMSYVMSPAAMFDPGVMRANANGGFQNPWSYEEGFSAPSLFQAVYPALKTLMIEHHWLQNAPVDPCNPAFANSVFACEPYYFNHGLDSSPVALFYDLHVRELPNAEVVAADAQIVKQTGGVDGLWHRGTPFGADGYLNSLSYDLVDVSHHVLTTDGILGRDTLGAAPKPASSVNRGGAQLRPHAAPPHASFARSAPFDITVITDE